MFLEWVALSTYTTILCVNHGGVTTITLNRPEKRNALSPTMMEEVIAALEHSASSTDCGVVVLTGAGGAFCAGLDLEHLEALANKTPDQHKDDTERIARMFRTLYDFPKPTIAAVNGAAIAGGTGLATICDFTLAVPEAKFGYTEVKIGFVPALVSSFLVLQVGEKTARDLLLTGRLIGAPEAHNLGLVNEIVSSDQLAERAEQLAYSLLQNSPESLRATKRLLSEHSRARLDAEIAASMKHNAASRQTADFQEGIRAFLEKRQPVWPSNKAR
jgi:methylglutaconyl-CoA hydratase